MSAGAGAAAEQVLTAAGASIGAQKDLLPELGNSNDLYVVFETFDVDGLAMAYAIARVLPIMNGVTRGR
jgi:hypothetical protein